MKTNQLLGLGLLGAAGWLYYRNRSAATTAATPTNAFGAPLNATKPAVFGFNTSRLDPTGTRQATNATANGGKTSNPTGGIDLAATAATIFSWFKKNPTKTDSAGNVALNQSGPNVYVSGPAYDAEIARFDAAQAVDNTAAGQAYQADTIRDFGID